MTVNTSGLIKALQLEDSIGAQKVAAGHRSIAAVHLGQGKVTIGKALNIIRFDESLTPPRTGHLGNWSDIAATRAGPMDFNSTICGQGHGYPLIYEFTRTEATTPGGDEAYAPGSIIDQGQRLELPIYTWDGKNFVQRGRDAPLFCALVQVKHQGLVQPLAIVQAQRMMSQAPYAFASWAGILLRNRALVVELLTQLIQQASGQGRSQAFDEIISHAVALDGTVERGALSAEGNGFRLAEVFFPNAAGVAEAALDLVSAMVEPEAFFERIGSVSSRLPVISLQCANALFAILSTHRYSGERGPILESPYRVHLHWGARAMAGAPPLRSGYLIRPTAQRSLRALVDPLLDKYPQVQPTVIAILPASIFMLCPTSRHPADAELLTELFTSTAGQGAGKTGQIAKSWFAKEGQQLSPYFRARFVTGAGVPRSGASMPQAHSVEPQGFRNLGIAEACAIAAAFEEGSE